jgi:hypothetical protein
MTQDGGSASPSLIRAGVQVGVLITLCGLATACISDVCPGDQIMIDRECTPAAVATEDAQNRRNLRATQAAEEERASDDATP